MRLLSDLRRRLTRRQRLWEVWIEGYSTTGQHARAHCAGIWPGNTFLDACQNWAESKAENRRDFQIHDGRAYFWSCRMFPDEAEARKGFG